MSDRSENRKQLRPSCSLAHAYYHLLGRHGNRSLEEFIALLGLIRLLVDVRAYPTSRRHPHFSREPLSRALADNGIEYAWQGKELGGLRKPSRESVNTGPE